MGAERPKESFFSVYFRELGAMLSTVFIIFTGTAVAFEATQPNGANKGLVLLNFVIIQVFTVDLGYKVLVYLSLVIGLLFIAKFLFVKNKLYNRLVLLPFLLLLNLNTVLGLVRGVQDGSLLKTDLGQVWPLYGEFLVSVGVLLL